MKYDLLQLIRDNIPILKDNTTLNDLVNTFIKDECRKVKDYGDGNSLILDSGNSKNLYMLDYYQIYGEVNKYVIKLNKKINPFETKEILFHIKNKNEFNIVYYAYETSESYNILKTYKLEFYKDKIIKGDIGFWLYDRNIEQIEDFSLLIADLENDYEPSEYDFNDFKSIQTNIYNNSRILPDFYLTMELDTNKNTANIDMDGKVSNISDKVENINIIMMINTMLEEVSSRNYYTDDIKDKLSMFGSLKLIEDVLAKLKEEKLIKTDTEKISDALKFYLQTTALMDKVRSGWDEKHWNVRKERLESIAEHTFKTIMLAISIYSEYDYRNINIYKVIAMLSIHELGEIKIGDITCFDGETLDSKEERELIAYKEVVASLTNKNDLISLYTEFTEKITPEAQFAYLCDKLDCDVTAKIYEDDGYNHLDDQENNPAYNSPRVQEILNSGFNTVADCFIEYDVPKYENDENFMKVLRYVQKNNIRKLGD